jgi:hypothetical protein
LIWRLILGSRWMWRLHRAGVMERWTLKRKYDTSCERYN